MKLRLGVVGVAVCAFVASSALALSAGKAHGVLAVPAWLHPQPVAADGGTPPPPWPGCGCFVPDAPRNTTSNAPSVQPAASDPSLADGGTPPPPWPGCGCFAPGGGASEPTLSNRTGVEMADGGTPPPPWPGCGCFEAEDEASPSSRARNAA